MEVVGAPKRGYYGSQFPEAVPITPLAEKSPKYFAQPSPDDTPKYSYEPQAMPPKSNRFTRWPFLLLFAVLIALLSGLIGGFIGKAITDNKHNNDANINLPAARASASASASPTQQSQQFGSPSSLFSSSTAASTLTSTSTSTSTSASSEPTATLQAQSEKLNTTVLAVPDTGCPDSSSTVQTFQTDFQKVKYQKFCGVDWTGGDMIEVLTPTLSDCVEACSTWNSNFDRGVHCGDGIPANPLACVAVSFAPEWTVNRTGAMAEVGKAGNCFLKAVVSGYPPSKRGADGVNVVGACLEGKCPPA